ncbi:hypothetical protein IV38_GL000252 [Lactobacillus selangorensis]|uniref:RNA-binding S4 domain-containing protein n=1 Tax=Lactobacillus selangorensis TaxID=81857 RepID=A0A0R2FLD1_9LACO|nr:RNA-binding protein [Lactobacillus selangorensis]KRN29368.1 hypothetical protein IV38_GL000252 [Lactobacillus selangorensis]KRN34103.1 hypothetical protein IV40_GL000417 [Lactobacillus selangorensis]
MDENVYQHFRKEERAFIDQVGNWLEQARGEYRPILTPFLDPRQAYILQELVGTGGEIEVHLWGGYPHAERRRGILAPDYFDPQEDDYGIRLFQIRYPQKFATLQHSQVLGTLTNQGIDYDRFGDIISDGQNWQFFVEAEISDFLAVDLQRIGKVTVHLEPVALQDHLLPTDDWAQETELVASLRLDNVVATTYHISRSHTKQMIEAGLVRLNWAVCERPDALVADWDVISVRGYGRIRLEAILGQTRKDKIRLSLRVIRK